MYYLSNFLHLVAVGTLLILQEVCWAQLSIYQRYNLSESLFRNDTLPLDYEIDERLNSSLLMGLNKELSAKLFKYDAYNKRNQKSLIYKLETLETSFKRMLATNRCKNVIILGLRYEHTWPKICEQLRHLTKHFGFKFEETHVAAYNQERLPIRPAYSRLILTFKKISTKQVYLLKFKEKLEEYEKAYNINSRTRKICRIANLGECEVYLQDDIASDEKILLSGLRRLQRSYPKLFNCYVKDSKVFYKLVNKIRPTIIDRHKDILELERTLFRMARSGGNFSKAREKWFRSGTAFPYDLIQYNRTRRKGQYRGETTQPTRVPPHY